MSKKISVILIGIIIIISLALSIYIPNKDKIKDEKEDTSINYSIIEKDGKKGVAQNDKTVIEPQYDEVVIPNQHREVFYCENGDDSKFVDSKNKVIFTDYDKVELISYDENKYERNILKYEKNGKVGLLSLTGKTVTENKYQELSSFGKKEGEVLVKENGEYGIIDEKGNSKIKNKYDSIESDGFYTDENGYKKSGYIVRVVTTDGYRYGYYDYDGTQVLQEEYNQITRLTEIKNDIYLIAAKNGQYGVYINSSKIINTQYQAIDYDSDLQIFLVEKTKLHGAFNLKGIEILPPEFTELTVQGIYLYGTKIVDENQEKKVYDVNGKVVNIPFDTIINKTSSSKYYIENENGSYFVLDSNLKKLTNQKYNFLEYAYDKYFIATNEQNKVGVIDLEEKVVVEFKYDIIQLIKGKSIFQALNFADNITDIYDSKFDLALEMSNANIDILSNGIRVYNNERENYLDNNGKITTKDGLNIEK